MTTRRLISRWLSRSSAQAGRIALVVVLLAPGGVARAQPAGSAGAGTAAAAGAVTLAGVPLGAETDALARVARAAGVTCVLATDGRSIVCPSPLVPSPLPTVGTFWLDGNGQIDRIFLVATLSRSSRVPFHEDFLRAQEWIRRALNAPPQSAPIPGWWPSPAIDNHRRLEDLLAGRARVETSWSLSGGTTVRLWLATENGEARLVIGVRRESAPAATGCDAAAVAGMLLDLFPPATPAVRAANAQRLAACRVSRAAGALGVALSHDPAPVVQAEALRALERIGAAPDDDALNNLAKAAPPAVAEAAAELVAGRRQRAQGEAAARAPAETPRTAAQAAAPPARARHPEAAAPAGASATTSASPPAGAAEPGPAVASSAPIFGPPAPAVVVPQAADQSAAEPVAQRPRGEASGTPLAIGASTAAGAVLMRNLGLMGLSGVSPQLLLGGAGAVIGFGTSWGLSRFGFKPTLGQAAFYTNTAAWGTLAGLMAFSASDSQSPKLQYGSLVLGEAAGMGIGVFAAYRWKWTPEQTVLADSLLLGVGLGALGVERLRDVNPHVTVTDAIATPFIMAAAALAAHTLAPTQNDLRLMTVGALGGAWTGGLVAAGGAGAPLFSSHQGQGGLALGGGVGFLGAAAAGAFTEVPARSIALGGTGVVAGNLLGLGLHMALGGGTRDATGALTLAPSDRDRWQLGAGLGGAVVGAAAFAYAPRLSLGPQALSMTITGAIYGGATWLAATRAGYDGHPVTDLDTARVQGGALAGAVAGGLTGLVASRWFSPDPIDQVQAYGSAGAGAAIGLGVVRLTSAGPGAADTLGVLAGAGGGLVAGMWLDRAARLRAPDFGAATAGAGYGAIIGALAPTLALAQWNDGRATSGGVWLGVGAGAAGSAALAHLTGASGAEVAVPSVAGIFGLGIGYGAGLLWPGDTSRPERIGTVIGPLAMIGGAILTERPLHFGDGLGPAATPLAISGGVYGGAWGLLLAGTLDRTGLISSTPGRQIAGGMLMGASAGTASGLALSRIFQPDSGDVGFTFAGSALGGALGLGIPALIIDHTGRADTLGTLLGSAGGMLGAALLAPHVDLPPPEIAAGFVAGGYGALVGTLAPTLFAPTWDGGRRAGGGALVGLGAGAIGAVTAAHLTHASSAEVTAASAAGTLGLAAGLGAGLMLPTESLRPARIGTVAGSLTGLGLSLALEPRLQLSQGLGPDAGALGGLGAAFGIADGLMVASALDPAGHLETTPTRRRFGGALLGATVEMTGGLLLSKTTQLTAPTGLVWVGGKLFGGFLGAGAMMLANAEPGRAETLATLGGSLAGLAGAVATERWAPLEAPDAAAVATGIGFGGLLGALGPSLGDSLWPGFDRQTRGGALVGVAAGAFGAAALRRSTEVPVTTVALAAAGGGDGLLTGLGVGLLLQKGDGDADGSRAPRIGMAAGTAAGLGIGAGLWPRLTLGPGDQGLIGAGSAVGGWTALWIPALGHASAQDFDRTKMTGGFLAGAGAASFATSLLTPALEVDPDLLLNAGATDALFSGAGAGIGALVSRRADAPVWGLLAGGTAGLVLGGALHRAIDLGADDAPLLALGGVEGAWLGAWLPYLLHERAAVTGGEQAGGLAAGTLGTLGLATLASGGLHLTTSEAGTTGLGSGIGAAIGGGAALLSPDLSGPTRVGLMLGGTGAGLLGGALISHGLEQNGGASIGAGAIGATLGASEALLFSWSGRAADSQQYAGAMLIGAGIGTGLGIASGASIEGGSGNAPAAAGFAAWGAWMGSFAGSLVKTDPHEIVLGGLAGANVGFLGGYGLLRLGIVEPRDFAWLSLFGALGTVAGAGAGAPFSRNTVLAGLAAGPAAGMLAGALVLPRLRRLGSGGSRGGAAAKGSTPGAPASFSLTSIPGRAIAGWRFSRRASGPDLAPDPAEEERVADRLVTSADIIADGDESGLWDRFHLGRSLKKVVEITDWAPMVGALPGAAAADPGAPAPMLIGLTGLWK